jgi:aryl-alcohol dehydrogenase-like predicted oxidoreductase
VAIPGTRKIHRLEDNLGSFKVELTNADLAVIQKAIPAETIGGRYWCGKIVCAFLES